MQSNREAHRYCVQNRDVSSAGERRQNTNKETGDMAKPSDIRISNV
jgi:hypothetical protein